MKKLCFISVLLLLVSSYIQGQQFNLVNSNIIPLDDVHISWGDMDNDNDFDFLITGSDDSYELHSLIYENKITEGKWFVERTDINIVGLKNAWSDWGDFDNDGDDDIIICGTNDNYNPITKIYENKIDEGIGFTELTGHGIPGVKYCQVEWVDSDNDGDQDIMITGQDMSYNYICHNYVNDGTGNFTLYFDLPDNITSIGSWNDFDKDGDLDLFGTYTNYTDDYKVLGAFVREKDIEYDTLNGPNWNFATYGPDYDGKVIWGDFDNDNDDDLAVTNVDYQGYNYLIIHINNIDSLNYFTDYSYASSNVEWGDFDNDNDLDLLVAGEDFEGYWRLDILENKTDSFYLDTSYLSGQLKWSYASWIDLDNDGYLDIMYTGYSPESYDPEIKFLYNRTSIGKGFIKENITPDIAVSEGVMQWGDFDNDGYLDPLITGEGDDYDNHAVLFKNNSGISFSAFDDDFIKITNGDVAWTDYDNDGDLDIFISGDNDDWNPVSKLYENKVNENLGFTEYEDITFVNLGNPSADWGDYDNDGDLDLLITGITDSYTYRTIIYENQLNVGNTFVMHSNVIPNLYGGESKWCDMNLDGYLDIVVSNKSSYSPNISIYINNIKQNNEFNLYTQLPTLENLSFDLGDIDNDGDQDIVYSGYDSDDLICYTYIFENKIPDQDTIEIITDIELSGVKNGAIKFADLDNDGDQDIVISGGNGNETITKLFENKLNVSQGFVELTNEDLKGLAITSLSLVDYDNDSDIDITLSGSENYDGYLLFYSNDTTTKNTAPNQPSNLAYEVADNEIGLSWDAATDGETAQSGLTYNMKVGTTSGGIDIVSPLSDNSGNRLIVGFGNTQSNAFAKLCNIPYDTYYWSVQAIDNAFKGGAFSTEASFTVGPDANFSINNNSICLNDTLIVQFTGYCYDTANTTFTWDFDGGTIISGTKNKPHYIQWSTPGTKTISLQISDGTKTSTLVSNSITVLPLPQITLEDEITECDGATVTLIPVLDGNINDYNFKWSTGVTTSSIDVVNDDIYLVTVTDLNSCSSVDSVDVIFKGPYPDASICVVTVDSGENIVVWERNYDEGIAYYNVYKETSQADEYKIMGSLNINELSVFVDTNSQPETRSERYKISVVDTCMNESELSEAHKTLHLTINLGTEGQFNLIWENYEGIDFASYYVLRGSSPDALETMDTIPNNITTYTDDPPSGTYYYQIAAKLPGLCSPASTLKASAGPYATSVSNMEKKLKASQNVAPTGIQLSKNSISEDATIGSLVGILTTTDDDQDEGHNYAFISGDGDDDNNAFTISGDSLISASAFNFDSKSTYSIRIQVLDSTGLEFEKIFIINITEEVSENIILQYNKNISIYPNPTSGYIKIESNNIEIFKVELTDMSGKIVYTSNSEIDGINVKKIDRGMFLLHIYTNKGMYIEKLIITK